MTHCGGSDLGEEDPAQRNANECGGHGPAFQNLSSSLGCNVVVGKGIPPKCLSSASRTQTLSQPGTQTACIIENKYISTHILKCDNAFNICLSDKYPIQMNLLFYNGTQGLFYIA